MSFNTVMLSIGMLAASFLGGIIFYYVMDNGGKKHKRFQLDQFLNVFIQFILYIWVSKILMQLNSLIHDPLGVLAYPANSNHFFLASILLVVHLYIKYRKNKTAAANLFVTSSFIFLSSLLLYEFFQMFVKQGIHLSFVTVMLTVLVLVYVLLYATHKSGLLASSLIGIFFVMAGSIAFYDGYFMLFDFMMGPYYFILFFILLFLYSYRLYKHKLFT